ncbi:MAG: FAD-dependent oxidoreductase, partial [Proteobacteria bacterium]|nr:FAD-dependent oxidoreductase [Pseudomonadota bacterium]
YLIPRLDGHILVGSTMEDTGFNKCITETAYRELFDWAISIYPDINKATLIKHWSGLRSSPGDQKPLIGAITGYENIYINAGHFRKGILQAPVSAKLLADHLAGITSFMSLENFNPSRVENSLKIA